MMTWATAAAGRRRGRGCEVVTLVFIGVLLAAVALDAWLIRPWERRHLPPPRSRHHGAAELVVPRTLFFHPGHTWARLEENGQVTVGVDDLVRSLVGELSAVELPGAGKGLQAGRPALAIRQGARRLQLAAPVSGRVVEVNAALGRDPVRLRWRPYKEGWAFRLAPGERLAAELGALAIGRDAERWMRAEMEALDRLFDRGVLAPPVEGALAGAGDEAWAQFQREHLKLDPEPAETRA